MLGEDGVERGLGRAEHRGVAVEDRGHQRRRVLAAEGHRARLVRRREGLGRGAAQFRRQAAEAHDLGVEDVDEPGGAAPEDRGAGGDGRAGVGVHQGLDEVGARVVGLALAAQAGHGPAVHRHVPASACAARTLDGRVAEGRVPELAARAGRAGDRPAAVHEDAADADLHGEEQDGLAGVGQAGLGEPGEGRVVAERLRDAGKQRIDLHVPPAQDARLHDRVAPHRARGRDRHGPHAAAVAVGETRDGLADGVQHPVGALGGVAAGRGVGEVAFEVGDGDAPVRLADVDDRGQGPFGVGVQRGGRSAAARGRRGALGDQVERAQARADLGGGAAADAEGAGGFGAGDARLRAHELEQVERAAPAGGLGAAHSRAAVRRVLRGNVGSGLRHVTSTNYPPTTSLLIPGGLHAKLQHP
ncbi:hypothetical protein SAMN05216270_11234 [Glycomyces harbinensis]|uniref:Uncharacterized protein n=1 Tax=Glycomyces harbinensis TaxID=58114 RepID=A0A1G6ZXY6_9ACTN|nr:hypothetical protein [Glycomyces harbinensis]SDE07544.1 hypothetical protein SAMN05216270_11234 [Glycomyces harbinensis]